MRQRTVLAVDDALKAVVDLLKQQQVYEDTYVVVTSDHGLAFGRKPAKEFPYEGANRIPLIVKGPGVQAGTTVHQMVNQADLAPTVLAWLSAPAMAVDGRSFAPLLGGTPPPVWRQAMRITHEHMGSAPLVPSWQGVRTTRYAYFKFQGGAAQLYDMAQDPGDKRNIAGKSLAGAEARRADRPARGLQRRGLPQPRGPGREVTLAGRGRSARAATPASRVPRRPSTAHGKPERGRDAPARSG